MLIWDDFFSSWLHNNISFILFRFYVCFIFSSSLYQQRLSLSSFYCRFNSISHAFSYKTVQIFYSTRFVIYRFWLYTKQTKRFRSEDNDQRIWTLILRFNRLVNLTNSVRVLKFTAHMRSCVMKNAFPFFWSVIFFNPILISIRKKIRHYSLRNQWSRIKCGTSRNSDRF